MRYRPTVSVLERLGHRKLETGLSATVRPVSRQESVSYDK